MCCGWRSSVLPENKMFTTFILFVLVHSSTAAIFNLNDTEYARMPPLFHMDNYEECFDEPDAVFCSAEFVLVSDEPSELLNLTQKISESSIHYNHTLLRHGFCMKKSCSKFFNASGTNEDIRLPLEACTNETIYNKYKLKTRLTDEVDCSKRDRDHPLDNLDIVVGVVCIMVLLANIIASLCDRYLIKGKNDGALRYLYCFSIYRNWRRFTALPEKGQDDRIKTLRGIHGIRTLSMFLVLAAHASFTSIVLIVDPKFTEDILQHKLSSIIMNGTLIMQTFFIISSFLLVYNWLISAEKEGTSLMMLPRQIITRWLRLTPSYALVLGLTSTWIARISYGPYWKKIVYNEVSDCRREWWRHILYINNFHQTKCMPQTWYLACDTQLYILGVTVFLTCKTTASRKVVLSFLFLVGILASVLHTYYDHLNGVMFIPPDTILNFFIDNAEFNTVYIRSYTNLTGSVIGMALGYIIYSWQKNGGNPKKLQKYKYLYWSLFLMGLLCTFSTYIFFVEGPGQPEYINILYAAFMKPVFGTIMGLIVAGVVTQFEGFYRAIFEWRPFIYTGRLCYSAYMLHIALIKVDAMSMIAVHRHAILADVLKGFTLVISSFIVAFFFWMLVETPFTNVSNILLKKRRKPAVEEKNETVKESKKAENENGTDLTQTQVEDGTIVIKMGASP